MITIIIPVYKVEPYIQQCISSVLSQKNIELEVLLIDDGSPDKCGEICDEYASSDNRVRVFHTKNNGLSAARNLGVHLAKGDYIGFVDSDDWIESSMYYRLLKRIQETGADMSVCGYWRESKNSKQEKTHEKIVYSRDEAFDALLHERIDNFAWNKLYRKELFLSVSFPEGKNFEDVATFHRILYHAKSIATSSSPEYHYRVREESITKTYSAKNVIDYADSFLDRYYFFKRNAYSFYVENEERILYYTARGICKVWRWWMGCNRSEKKRYSKRIDEFHHFTKEHFPLLGYKSWPRYLRFSTLFMHSKSKLSFMILFILNRVYRRINKVRLDKC